MNGIGQSEPFYHAVTVWIGVAAQSSTARRREVFLDVGFAGNVDAGLNTAALEPVAFTPQESIMPMYSPWLGPHDGFYRLPLHVRSHTLLYCRKGLSWRQPPNIMIRLLIRVMTVTAMCSAMLVTVRLGGSLNKPLGAAILEANRCDPQPCWQGLRPGAVGFDQVVPYLRSRGAIILTPAGSDPCWYMLSAPFWRSCARSLGKNRIDYVDVELPPDELRLGDAILQFGDPIGLEFCPVVNARQSNLPPRFTGAFISFPHGVWLLAYNPLHLDGGHAMIDPGMIVWRMSYNLGSSSRAGFPDYAWHGFSERSARNQWCVQE